MFSQVCDQVKIIRNCVKVILGSLAKWLGQNRCLQLCDRLEIVKVLIGRFKYSLI